MIDFLKGLFGRIDEKTFVIIMFILVVVITVCMIVSMITLDRDNEEMRLIIEGLLKQIENEKKDKTGE